MLRSIEWRGQEGGWGEVEWWKVRRFVREVEVGWIEIAEMRALAEEMEGHMEYWMQELEQGQEISEDWT